MSVEKLVKRLRGVDHMSVEDCFLQSHLFGHAADKLEELAAANERLRGALEQIEQQLDYGQIDTALQITRSTLEGGEA